MRGRGDSARRDEAAAAAARRGAQSGRQSGSGTDKAGGYPAADRAVSRGQKPPQGGYSTEAQERTLRQDALRAGRPPAADDDIFGDLYLDFGDTTAPRAAAPEPAEPAEPAEPDDDPDRTSIAPPYLGEPTTAPQQRQRPLGAGPPPEERRPARPAVPTRRPIQEDEVPDDVDNGPRPQGTIPLGPPEPARASAPRARIPSVAAGPQPRVVQPPAQARPGGPPAPPRIPPAPTAAPPAPAAPAAPAEVVVEQPDDEPVTTGRTDRDLPQEGDGTRLDLPQAAGLSVQAAAWSGASHPGRRRVARRQRLGLEGELTARDNDDRYVATGDLFVVADGLGGHPAGWYAADVAVRTLVADLAGADLAAGWSDRLRAAVARADLMVRRHGTAPEYEGMRTTIVVAVLQDGRLHLAGCGDSVCWLIRGGQAFRLTEQGNAADLGRPWLLTSTPLGGSQLPDPELQRIELHAGDRVVLATDGVGHLPDETVAELVHGDPFLAARTLTVTAVESGDDDATAVVVDCDSLPVAVDRVELPGPR